MTSRYVPITPQHTLQESFDPSRSITIALTTTSTDARSGTHVLKTQRLLPVYYTILLPCKDTEDESDMHVLMTQRHFSMQSIDA